MSDVTKPPVYQYGPENRANLLFGGDIASKDDGTYYPVVAITVLATDNDNVVFFDMNEMLELVGQLAKALADATLWANYENADQK